MVFVMSGGFGFTRFWGPASMQVQPRRLARFEQGDAMNSISISARKALDEFDPVL